MDAQMLLMLLYHFSCIHTSETMYIMLVCLVYSCIRHNAEVVNDKAGIVKSFYRECVKTGLIGLIFVDSMLSKPGIIYDENSCKQFSLKCSPLKMKGCYWLACHSVTSERVSRALALRFS